MGPHHLPLATETREQNLIPDKLCPCMWAASGPPHLRSRGRRRRLLPAWVPGSPVLWGPPGSGQQDTVVSLPGDGGLRNIGGLPRGQASPVFREAEAAPDGACFCRKQSSLCWGLRWVGKV